MRIKVRAEDVASATGMRQQLMDRYFRGDVLVRIVGQIFSDRIVERELAGLREL